MKFSKVSILIILLSMSLLSACNKEITVTFFGESDNWSVYYETSQPDEKGKCRKGDGHFKYIGNKPTPKRLEYSIFNEKGDGPVIDGTYPLGMGCNHADADTEIEAIIIWDGNSETIPLTVK